MYLELCICIHNRILVLLITITILLVFSGLEVRALMRDPSRMPEELRKQVEVFTGDVLVSEDVDKAVEGRDAVVVTLGTRNDLGMVLTLQAMLGEISLNKSY